MFYMSMLYAVTTVAALAIGFAAGALASTALKRPLDQIRTRTKIYKRKEDEKWEQ